MRTVLFSICWLLSTVLVNGQTFDNLEGTYKRYVPTGMHGHKKQTLILTGAASGTYTLTTEAGGQPDFTSGRWKRARVGRDSMDVVVLDYENEFECIYYAIEHTGCLTRVFSNGRQLRRRNSFAPDKNRTAGR